MVRRSLLLTHTDLDGIATAVLVAAQRPEVEIEAVDNGAIQGRLQAHLDDLDPGSLEIWVADHSLDSEQAAKVEEFLARGGAFTLLDHHPAEAGVASKPWATVDPSRCATTLVFERLGSPASHREFASLVEDHDLWRHADPRSAALAALLDLLGRESFRRRFVADPRVEFDAAERLLLERAAAWQEEYLEKKARQARVVTIGGRRWALAYAERYQSQLADHLMNSLEVQATAVMNPGNRTVSLRGRGCDVSPIAAAQGGGGHARAAAFSFRGRPLELTLERFEEDLERLLEPRE